MNAQVPSHLRKVAEKMAQVGRTEYKMFRRPNWKLYNYIKYENNQPVDYQAIWVNEAEVFPSDEDFFWEPDSEGIMNHHNNGCRTLEEYEDDYDSIKEDAISECKTVPAYVVNMEEPECSELTEFYYINANGLLVNAS